MLIDRIFNKTKSLLNTDVIGNFSPAKFNEFLHDAMQERNEEYFIDLKKHVNRENRGLNSSTLENVPDRYREKIAYYSTDKDIVFEDDLYTLPSDYRYIDTLSNSAGADIEFCKNSKEFNIYKSFVNSRAPIGRISGATIKVFPTTTETLSLTYLRKIKYPKWTYVIASGSEMFNPDADDFQDADIHSSEEDEMVRRVLLRFGIHLKEKDIQAYLLRDEETEFKKSNTD